MSRRGPRGLTSEEQELWNRVRQKTVPLHLDRPKPVAQQVLRPKTPAPKSDIPLFQIGERRTETALPQHHSTDISDHVARQPLRMDRKNFGKLKRGKLSPEARIDLHGMTVDQAHPVLTRFILDSHAQQRRLVLVITGKGKTRDDDGPIPVRRGVLRHQVPHWLHTPPLSHAVLQITEAHLKHGGGGAYYVYLRRPRQ